MLAISSLAWLHLDIWLLQALPLPPRPARNRPLVSMPYLFRSRLNDPLAETMIKADCPNADLENLLPKTR